MEVIFPPVSFRLLVGRLSFGWLVDLLVNWLVGWLVGRSVGWLVGWFVSMSVSWLVY